MQLRIYTLYDRSKKLLRINTVLCAVSCVAAAVLAGIYSSRTQCPSSFACTLLLQAR